MAEVEVGKQCSVSTCKQLDFLPFTCSDCSAIFCLEHRSTTSHNCEGNSSHEVDPIRPSSSEISKSVECFFDGCNVRCMVAVKCEHCKREFCLRHRHEPDHLCRKYEKDKNSKYSASCSEVKIERKEKTGRGGARSSSRAAKVALMKMKLHAVGESSTPLDERVFFSIILPEDCAKKSISMFFSKKWSIGRIIDQISTTYKLWNENNRQLSKKLRLFEKCPERKLTIEKSLETEMSENSETLFSGSELILQYVER